MASRIRMDGCKGGCMVWLGILGGLAIGAMLESFTAALWLAVLGGFIGFFWRRDDSAARLHAETRIHALQTQLTQITTRLEAVEARLNGGAAAAAGAATPEVIVPPAAPAASEQPEEPAIPDPVSTMAAAIAKPAQTAIPVTPPAVASPSETRPASRPVEPAPVRAEETRPAKPRAPKPSPTPTWLQTFLQRWVFGGNPIVKVGVLILFLGLAFLLRYAAEHAVLPLGWRYAGVAGAGIALLALGWRWRGRADNYGLILQGAGVGVLYLTTLAAMKLHPLVPPEFGFPVLLVVAVLAALLAVLQNAMVLAVIGSIGGFAAPVLTSTGGGNHIALFSYLTLLNLGILSIAWFKAWRVLNLIGFVATFALGSAWAAKYYRHDLFGTTEPFLLLFFVVYVLITFLFARRTMADAPDTSGASVDTRLKLAATRVSYVDGTLAFGVPFSTFGLQYLLVKPWEYGAAYSALGFGFAYVLLAAMLFRQTRQRYILLAETMIALGVIFASLAIPLGLEQSWTSAAWAVEAAGVYWVGVRQQRTHARLFALLLLFGSATYFALGLRFGTGNAVLDGSLLGGVLLALSIWWCHAWLRRAQQVGEFEAALRPYLVAFGAFFVALLPFLLWPMNWAAPALTVIAAGGVYAGVRLSERPLLYWSWLYQAVAGALFITTLHRAGGGSVLGDGWSGLFAAALIGASMLAGVWAFMRRANANQEQAPVSGAASIALLAGMAFINLAPLFVLPWRLAAMVWPLTAILSLWWALRARHKGAIGFAIVLQVLAGAAYFYSRWPVMSSGVYAGEPSFGHTGFWGPIVIALAGLLCARLFHKQRSGSSAGDRTLGWTALAWAVLWWAFGWSEELARTLPAGHLTAALVATTVASAAIAALAAIRLSWRELGQASQLYLPCLGLILLSSQDTHPLASLAAAAAWPLALAAHFWLMRKQAAWIDAGRMNLSHVFGAWLFVILAAIELRWQFAGMGNADNAWPLLGWMLAPVAYLLLLTSQRLRSRWPLRDHQSAYREISALPIVVYLLAWTWISNVLSDGNAHPLPYITLLNPLEVAQIAILLGILSWAFGLRNGGMLRGRMPLVFGAVGLTGLAVLTGMVLRTCHHFGGIPWEAHALMTSRLAQSALSVTWSVVAIGMMLIGNRQGRRAVWIAGSTLIGVVVIKLFVVELAATGSLERIVSFIVVGMLLLLVGYFAPLPPKRAEAKSTSEAAA
jgi:uncharacterized membrane protein